MLFGRGCSIEKAHKLLPYRLATVELFSIDSGVMTLSPRGRLARPMENIMNWNHLYWSSGEGTRVIVIALPNDEPGTLATCDLLSRFKFAYRVGNPVAVQLHLGAGVFMMV